MTIAMRAEVLDQVVKSIMQSVSSNATKKRRLNPKSQTFRDATREGDLLDEALQALLAAQRNSFGNEAS